MGVCPVKVTYTVETVSEKELRDMKKMWKKTVLCGFFYALILLNFSRGSSLVVQAVEHNFLTQVTARETTEEGAVPSEKTLQLYATSAVLMDAVSGRVLYGKNEAQIMPMASTTKVMTAIVILEELRSDLDCEVAISSYAASMPKVKLYVKKGEKYRLRDLMYSLMLESHNDSAVALAEYVGKEYVPHLEGREPSEFTVEESKQAVAAFARLMNKKARQLGCENTYFITPNGLDAQEDVVTSAYDTVTKIHSTTATELARIFSYCILRSPCREEFLKITRTGHHSFASVYPGNRSFHCSNHNTFLSMMPGALSGKTGFTNQAGYCYVGALQSEGRTFVVALLACGWPSHKNYKWSDTRQLMQYGMEHFFYRDFTAQQTAYPEGRLPELPVEGGEMRVLGESATLQLRISRDRYEGIPGMLLRKDQAVRVQCRLPKQLKAPVYEGNIIGSIVYSVDNTIYRKEYIVAENTIEKMNFSWCFYKVWEYFMNAV